ncbi:MAG TPA: aquaporin [Methylomirabilota bacterium]|nr:aquaporin [Methylomirabilota bacterium]
MREALTRHWPEYAIEAAGLGLFMVSACLFAAFLYHPSSPAAQALPDPLLRRILMGLAMGLTAIALIYSPWGQQSGAHFNPAVTLTFLRLGRITGWDALFYVTAQCGGGVAGVILAAALTRGLIADRSVNFAVTVPGEWGPVVAFAAEVVISGGLMLVVLTISNTPRLSRFTGLFAGALVAVYITLEAPLSGMSMNPARSLASALPANVWTAFWIYLTAPTLGMLLAAELHHRARRPVKCAKLHHDNARRCIFRCGYMAAAAP